MKPSISFDDTPTVIDLTEDEPAAVVLPPTKHELNLVKFCSAYSDLSFATISATYPPLSDYNLPTTDTVSTPPGASKLETELSSLIGKGMLEHRIDAVDEKLVLPKRGGPWRGIRDEALRAAREHEHELLLRLHRVDVVLTGIEVKKGKGSVAGLRRWC